MSIFPHTYPTCVIHGVWEKVRPFRAQAESSYWVPVAVHIVNQLILPQVPHLHKKTKDFYGVFTKGHRIVVGGEKEKENYARE